MSLRIPNLQYTLQVYSGIRDISGISGSWFVGMFCWHGNYAAIFTEDLKIASGNSSARTVRRVRCLEQLLVYFRTVAPSQRQVILRTPSANLLQALEINFKKLQESSMNPSTQCSISRHTMFLTKIGQDRPSTIPSECFETCQPQIV